MERKILDGDRRQMNTGGTYSVRAVHAVHIENRSLMSVTGVSDVDFFNESEISLMCEEGELRIEGEELHITKLDLEQGQVIIEGSIIAMEYAEPVKEKGSLFSRMFR